MHAPEDKLDKIEGDVIQICQPTEKYNGKNEIKRIKDYCRAESYICKEDEMMTEEIPRINTRTNQSERQSATKKHSTTQTEKQILTSLVWLTAEASHQQMPINLLLWKENIFISKTYLFPPFLRIYSPDGTALAAKSDKMDEFYRPILHYKIHQSQTMNTTTFTNGKHHKQELSL